MEVSPEVTPPPVEGHAKIVETHAAHDSHAAHVHGHHGDDPSNPIYFGLPIGIIIASAISAIAVGITLLKFFYFS